MKVIQGPTLHYCRIIDHRFDLRYNQTGAQTAVVLNLETVSPILNTYSVFTAGQLSAEI